MTEVEDQYLERFKFLFPEGSPVLFSLHSPDIHDFRWSVFDREAKKTIGYGRTPEDAVDVAREVTRMRPFQMPYQDEFNLQ